MSLQPFLSEGVLIEPASTQFSGFVAGTAGSGGFPPAPSPILYNGALYQVLQANANLQNQPINVKRSGDRGSTWQTLDPGNAPNKQSDDHTAGIFFDGNHTIILAWLPTGGAGVAMQGAVNLKNFDLSTQTWGPTYAAAGAPLVWTVQQAFQRPDGSILVLAAAQNAGLRIFGTTAYVFAGGAWSNFACDTNLVGGRESSGNIAAVMDSTGRVHLFMIATDPANILPEQNSYQLINTNNTLGTFAVVQTGIAPAGNLPGVPEMQPAISGDNVIVGLVDETQTFVSVSVGTPLSAPVFTRSGPIDSGAPASVFRFFAPAIACDSSGVYAAYLVQLNDANSTSTIQLTMTPNVNAPLTGWVPGIQAFNAATSPNASVSQWDFLQLSRQGGNTFASAIDVLAFGAGEATQFWLGVFSPPATVFSGGSSSGRVRCCPPEKIQDLMQAGEVLRQMLRQGNAWPWVHLFPPFDAVELNLIGDLVAPSPVPNLRISILQYTVPAGMRLFLFGVLQDVETAAFNPGDALWTVDENTVAGSIQGAGVQGLIGSPVPLGSVSAGRWWPFNRPYEFPEWTLLRSTVQNVNVPQAAPNYFVSGFLGYLVPVKR